MSDNEAEKTPKAAELAGRLEPLVRWCSFVEEFPEADDGKLFIFFKPKNVGVARYAISSLPTLHHKTGATHWALITAPNASFTGAPSGASGGSDS